AFPAVPLHPHTRRDVHLKSLTLKGFKSFAAPTTLRFEPGITCVVGPNGSGKSNVVDAIAWVLGEQGAKALRGGKMEDVIFAGTPGKPPLGRAEVTLTIDNSDGALPIEYAEVSVSRLMFRSGESEYAINGQRCRLLDIQELMGDSGIGRELHVVVGQGQLDAVLQARPEERRGFIEEAAGVLKHRKRKEKAVRKLEAMQANLTRLQDLTVELRRQLKPLGKQAEVARRAAQVQADLRDARLRLLADDLLALRGTLEAEVRDETALRERRSLVEQELTSVQERETALETAAAEQAPRLARAQETWYRLSALEERLRGTATLASERHRHLTSELPEEARAGRDPEQLDREAATVREQEAALGEQLQADAERLQATVTRRTDAEGALAAEEKALVAAVRAVADRREGLARLRGQVGALRSRAEGAEAEIGRLAAALADAHARVERAQGDLAALQAEAGGLDQGEVDLDDKHERAAEALAQAQDRLAALQADEREAERDRSTFAARRDALALSLTRKDGSGALLAGDVPGVLGSVAALVTIAHGHEHAVSSALGAVADAVAVASPAAAAQALARLKTDDAGRAGLLVGGASYDDAGEWPQLPPGAQWAIDLVEAPEALRPALARALRRVAVVDGLEAARALVESVPDVRAVTAEGDLLGSDWAIGGSASAPSLIEVQAAVDEAAAQHDEAKHRQERLRFEVATAQADVDRAKEQVEVALVELHESDARMAALGEQLGLLASAARAAEAEAGRLEQARVRAEEARDRDLSGLAELEERLAAAEAAPDEGEPSTELRDRLGREAADARAAEVEARLAVRTGEERARALAGRAESLERAARQEREARERLVALRDQRQRGAAVAADVVRGARVALDRIAVSLQAAAAEREAAQAARTVTEGELLALRARGRELAAEMDRLTDVVHRDEVARAEQRLRIEALEARAVEEYAVPLESLFADYGPDVAVPVEDGEPVAYDRIEQEKRAATQERALALLGRVNPLALEEYSALEERSAFLTTQLEDLKATRRDLLTVIKDVDDRIHEVFRSAFEDTAREFVHVFATLFPGGEGKLVLTEPDDMLATGIEVLARPAGKKVSRLSLLSGGERSLTAIALLVAIFRARPSPFYVLDEVEAALDERNLGRLLDLLEGLRDASQLIVITHQKRTMEIADALYGVTMRGDGVSAVVSQRLREREPA
ncbi:MAG: chromosome segregation protein, partial [Actinomycetota bacterium]|nr:chromosome segregation protein [Actinomycetota bacterium]